MPYPHHARLGSPRIAFGGSPWLGGAVERTVRVDGGGGGADGSSGCAEGGYRPVCPTPLRPMEVLDARMCRPSLGALLSSSANTAAATASVAAATATASPSPPSSRSGGGGRALRPLLAMAVASGSPASVVAPPQPGPSCSLTAGGNARDLRCSLPASPVLGIPPGHPAISTTLWANGGGGGWHMGGTPSPPPSSPRGKSAVLHLHDVTFIKPRR